MNVHYLQHVPFEGLGAIKIWLDDKEHKISSTKFYDPEFLLPDISEIDALIVLGGPMGIYEESVYQWLKEEKLFIKSCIAAGKKVLGICLGAQLIAGCLGAKVTPATHKEIGCFPVFPTEESKKLPWFYKLFSNNPIVFHWHADRFEIPDNGSLDLLYSEANKHQAFYYNKKVIGLQFHLEVTQTSLLQMLENGKEDIEPLPYVQSEAEIHTGVQNTSTCNTLMNELLNNWLYENNQ